MWILKELAALSPLSGPLRRRGPLGLCAGALLVHLLFFLYGGEHPGVLLTADSHEYLWAARNLLEAQTLYAGNLQDPLQPDLFSRRTPLFPLLAAAALFIWDSPRAVSLLLVLLNFVNFALFWKILGWFDLGERGRLWLGAAFLFYPGQLIYSHVVMAELPLQTFLLASVHFLGRFLQTSRTTDLLLLNLCVGLAPLVKPVMLYFWIPSFLFQFWLLGPRQRRRLLPLALLPPLLLGAWGWRNERVTGEFHISSLGRDVQGYLLQRMGLQPYSEETLQKYPALEGAPRLPPFLNFALYQARGMLFFFLDPGRFDLYQFSGLEQEPPPHAVMGHDELRVLELIGQRLRAIPVELLVVLAGMTLFNLLVLLAFCRFVLKSGSCSFPPLRIFLILLVFYCVLVTGGLGRSRYRVSLEPLLLVSLSVLAPLGRSRLHRKPQGDGLSTPLQSP